MAVARQASGWLLLLAGLAAGLALGFYGGPWQMAGVAVICGGLASAGALC